MILRGAQKSESVRRVTGESPTDLSQSFIIDHSLPRFRVYKGENLRLAHGLLVGGNCEHQSQLPPSPILHSPSGGLIGGWLNFEAANDFTVSRNYINKWSGSLPHHIDVSVITGCSFPL